MRSCIRGEDRCEGMSEKSLPFVREGNLQSRNGDASRR